MKIMSLRRMAFIFLITSILGSESLFAQGKEKRQALTSKPIATVNLHKPELLTSTDFDNEVEGIEAVTGSKLPAKGLLELRQKMIDNIIVSQAAERVKAKSNQKEILELLRRQVNQPKATMNELKKMYEESPASKMQSWDKLIKRLEKESLMADFFRKQISRDDIRRPTDSQVRRAFAEHKSSFSLPTAARVSHVFFSFKTVKTKAEARQKAERALAELSSGRATFEELVRKYSEDSESSARLGDIGYMTDVPQARQVLGNEFINAIVSLPGGRTSGIITTSEGYHIIKVTEKQPRKQLSLTDTNPTNPNSTIYQLVEQQLMELEYRKKIEDLVKKLRSQAKISINEDSWKARASSK